MDGSRPQVGGPPRVLLVAAGGLAAAVAGWLLLVALGGADGGPRPEAPPGSPPARAEARAEAREALAALRAWDDARARAWAAGDAAALRSLYTRDSTAGRRDRAMLAAWRARDLRVAGMRTQVLAADVDALSDDRIVLTTTDRLAAATAVGTGRRWELPADLATTRRVVLRRVGGSWRVVSVVGHRAVSAGDDP